MLLLSSLRRRTSLLATSAVAEASIILRANENLSKSHQVLRRNISAILTTTTTTTNMSSIHNNNNNNKEILLCSKEIHTTTTRNKTTKKQNIIEHYKRYHLFSTSTRREKSVKQRAMRALAQKDGNNNNNNNDDDDDDDNDNKAKTEEVSTKTKEKSSKTTTKTATATEKSSSSKLKDSNAEQQQQSKESNTMDEHKSSSSSSSGVISSYDLNGERRKQQQQEEEKEEKSSSDSTRKEEPLIHTTPSFSIPPPPTPSIADTKPPLVMGRLHEFAPRIVVVGIGGGGGNAVNNMIARNLNGVEFLALNTDAQHLSTNLTDNRLQIGMSLTSGLGCGANPDAGRLAAEESKDMIMDQLRDAHMVFITAGMGGGTGTGAAPVVAELCYNAGIVTVGVVTEPFRFEGTHRMRLAKEGIARLAEVVDTLIVIPNQNLFQIVTDKTSFMDSFAMADDILLAGVKSITDLMTSPGLINLDFADVQTVMLGMGNAMLGTGQACTGDDGVEDRAIEAAERAMSNPLLGEQMDVSTAKGMLVNITGGKDMTLFEVDRAAQCITERVEDENANIIFGSAYDESLDGCLRVSVVATGIDSNVVVQKKKSTAERVSDKKQL